MSERKTTCKHGIEKPFCYTCYGDGEPAPSAKVNGAVKAAPAPSNLAGKMLQVARSMPQPFTREQLVLACWRAHPKEFGLRGSEYLYPDSNRVLSFLYHKRGLKDHVAAMGGGSFRVKVHGRD